MIDDYKSNTSIHYSLQSFTSIERLELLLAMSFEDCISFGLQVIRPPETKGSFLPKEAIDEYQKLYLKEFGEEISAEEATIQANNLVNLFKMLKGY